MKKETVWASVTGMILGSFFCGIAAHSLEWHETFAWFLAVGIFMYMFRKEVFQ